MHSPTAPQKHSWLMGFGVFFVLGYLLFGQILSDNPPPQPIRYNHAVHIASGLACVDCHVGAREQVQATLPGLDTCLMCHEEALTESPEEERLRAFANAGQEIPWERVTRVPRHVYFSHRRHVTLAGLECTDCHGPMETRTEPPRRPFRPVTMDACMDCHEQRKVDNDCNRCHR
ncbi:MAG: cytochrome c3 family protein [Terriglobia bacterium]